MIDGKYSNAYVDTLYSNYNPQQQSFKGDTAKINSGYHQPPIVVGDTLHFTNSEYVGDINTTGEKLDRNAVAIGGTGIFLVGLAFLCRGQIKAGFQLIKNGIKEKVGKEAVKGATEGAKTEGKNIFVNIKINIINFFKSGKKGAKPKSPSMELFQQKAAITSSKSTVKSAKTEVAETLSQAEQNSKANYLNNVKNRKAQLKAENTGEAKGPGIDLINRALKKNNGTVNTTENLVANSSKKQKWFEREAGGIKRTKANTGTPRKTEVTAENVTIIPEQQAKANYLKAVKARRAKLKAINEVNLKTPTELNPITQSEIYVQQAISGMPKNWNAGINKGVKGLNDPSKMSFNNGNISEFHTSIANVRKKVQDNIYKT